PLSPLKLGASGSLNGHTWQVRAHALTEIDQVGHVSQQHEYNVIDDSGNEALLVYGLIPEQRDWYLFLPVQSSAALTATAAAAKKTGETVNLDGADARISRIFQRLIRQTEAAENNEQQIHRRTYGFTAQSNDAILLAEWDENYIAFYRGKAISR